MTAVKALAKYVQRLWRERYEPARYYMRGPGPAWRTKQLSDPLTSDDADGYRLPQARVGTNIQRDQTTSPS